jgi:NADPH-dependent 2,4-dienoyl-CoA reductase/sulfur reductase-like enzyme/flavorubredoxin
MEIRQLSPVVWQVSALEPERRVFGPVCYTDSGCSFHTYLLDVGDGLVSFGSVPSRYLGEWVKAIRALAGDRLRGAVLFGTRCDRAAAKALLDRYPELTFFADKSTLFQLGGQKLHAVEIRNDRTLKLGSRELQFHVLREQYAIPCVYVVDRENGILLTADAFGSVCAVAGLVSEMVDQTAFWQGAAKYYADILGPRRRESLQSAIKLVADNQIRLILPASGPAVDAGLDRLLDLYAAPISKPEGLSAAVVYAPGNFIPELACAVQAGLKESGDITVKGYDLSAENRETILRELPQADAYLFGAPEIFGEAAKPVWDILTSLTRADCAGKPACIFTSTHSVGNAAADLRSRLTQLGCDVSLTDLILSGVPGKQEMENAYEYGFSAGCYLQKISNPHRPILVKCLVCGEVFDASLGTCPVCGVGLDQCVPVDTESVTFRRDTENRYVILGGGVAAVSAAEAIRLRDQTGSIKILSAETYLPINRPKLTKDLRALAADLESIQIHDAQWYALRKIQLLLGTKAISLDPTGKTVTTEDGAVYGYDKLIYATGAECFVPPFPGHEKKGVLTIRHLWDSRELQAHLDAGAKNAVVIGGGVLGLEAASELMRAGVRVTVLEATPQIVGRQIDAGSAAVLKAKMEGLGVSCYEGVSIAGIEGDGAASGVRLADGRVFPADFVLVSCGNRGNVSVARQAGAVVEQAIVVNDRMETNLPDVYACGDCAQFEGVNYQLWQEASSQGKVAGGNAAGETISYAGQQMGLSLEGFGTSLFALGDPGKKELPYQTVETVDQVSDRHEKYWFFGGRLEGAVVIGAPEKTADISQAVMTNARYTELF